MNPIPKTADQRTVELNHRSIRAMGRYRDLRIEGTETETLLQLYRQMLRLRRTDDPDVWNVGARSESDRRRMWGFVGLSIPHVVRGAPKGRTDLAQVEGRGAARGLGTRWIDEASPEGASSTAIEIDRPLGARANPTSRTQASGFVPPFGRNKTSDLG